MDMDLAAPLHRAMLTRVRGVLNASELRSTVTAEMFMPIVERHQPAGTYVGDPCAACERPWPCKILLDTLLSIR